MRKKLLKIIIKTSQNGQKTSQDEKKTSQDEKKLLKISKKLLFMLLYFSYRIY